MKTLADMTAEERAQCVGMWCEDENSNSLCIYMGEYIGREWLAMCAYPNPEYESDYASYATLDDITPRPDLPRAWTPGGKPPVGEWEYDYVGTDGCSMITGEYVDPKPGEEIRRFVGDWEQA